MKKILVVGLMMICSTVFAEVREEITSLRTMNFNGRSLVFSYQVGGGSNNHTADVQVELSNVTERHGEYSADAKIRIFDVVPLVDTGRAILTVNGTADLEQLITDKVKEIGITTGFFSIKKVELLPVDFLGVRIQ